MAGATKGGDGDLRGSKRTVGKTRAGGGSLAGRISGSKQTSNPPTPLPQGKRQPFPKSVIKKAPGH